MYERYNEELKEIFRLLKEWMDEYPKPACKRHVTNLKVYTLVLKQV